ncbi:hypothetical protein JZ751_018751 [Albula glossodonta]|uniref:Uncharacterized protein n=1 Tax=Albula glossodonta TaxID=121402 RepID=A0A8T2NZ79_9TELE|nr:hypothetical protein JZ751_018751 [Albula glossodonta]
MWEGGGDRQGHHPIPCCTESGPTAAPLTGFTQGGAKEDPHLHVTWVASSLSGPACERGGGGSEETWASQNKRP